MTRNPPVLGRIRPEAPARPGAPAPHWSDPAVWTVAALVVGIGFTAMVTLTEWFPKGYRVGSLSTEVNAVDGAIALLVAYLSHGRFVREHRLRHRLIGHGLALMGANSLVLPAAAPLLDTGSGGTPGLWTSAVLRAIGAALIVAGAVAGDAGIRRMPRRGAGLALPVVLLGSALAVTAAVERSLPPAVVSLGSRVRGPLGFASDPVFGAMQLFSAVGLLAAALLLTRLSLRHGRDPIALKGPAFALGGFALLQYVLFPTLSTDWLYTGDVLRTGSYALLLLGAVLEIRRYWTGQSRAAVLADRRRLAREIHDGVVQEISYIRMESRSLPAHDGVDRIVDACDRALDEARDGVHALALSDDEPLEHLLQRTAHDLSRRHAIDVVVRLEGDPAADPDQRHGLVRIVREAIANAARHGGARRVEVELAPDELGWSLEVRDDGRGFDPVAAGATAGGYGLVSMRERADALPGRCLVESRPGSGTTVKVMW